MPVVASQESEWRTRKIRIDTRLKALGWKVTAYQPATALADLHGHAIEEYPTDSGPADYALCVDGQIFGIVEAKKVSLGPQNVLVQAQRYARGVAGSALAYGEYRVPFLYSTNGEVQWFHDVRHPLNLSRRITDFHTPSALREMLGYSLELGCQRLLQLPNQQPGLRDYQREANTAVEQAIRDHKRQMLVAMATGTGKTFTTVNQAYRLLKAGLAQRILFLVDRRALAAQAVNAFASFEPEPGLKFDRIYEVYSQRFRREDMEEGEAFDPKVMPASYLLDPQASHSFVYVCTIQRMAINLFGRQAMFEQGDDEAEDDAERLDIPIHAFDVIIADECHRGYTSAEVSVWRNTLDHFDAIKIGLTATPAAHTKAYFKEVAYRYEYERAVREGHLVDFDAVRIRSEIRLQGVSLEEGENVVLIDTESGQEHADALEDRLEYDTTDLERKVTVPESNRLIVEEIKKYALEHEASYGRFPKTLIFAANDLPHRSHAEQLVHICREVFGRGESFVQKITGTTTDRPLQRIREFRNRPDPKIVVSVDMLTTGVDIPALEFIVFLRPVKSRILWDQMLGRGTRRCKDLVPQKSHFTVFDCFDGTLFAYFRDKSAMSSDPPEKPSRTLAEVIDDIWNNRNRAYNVRCLVKRLQRIDKEMSGEARALFAAYIPEGDMARYAASLPTKLASAFTETMALLRNPEFQALLVEYPRARLPFVKAPDMTDTVSSDWLIRGDDGKQYKPEDYLVAFAKFVKENPAQIEAIQILLNRPQEWGTDALNELHSKLSTAKERFTVGTLQQVHAAAYGKSLVDIISMVKHAAKEEEPLLTAAERVAKALARITAGQVLNEEQQHWLERIRAHLVENLSIDRDDFDTMPIFSREGGWGKANRIFDERLETIIKELNEAMAA